MNAKDLALGLLVMSTIILTSLAASERIQTDSLGSRIQSIQVKSDSPLAATISTATVTVTSSISFHDLTFNQTNQCPTPIYVGWVVELVSSNSSTRYIGSGDNATHSITFSVPDGTYAYTITPTSSSIEGNLQPDNGSVIISGSPSVVQAVYYTESCGSELGMHVTSSIEAFATPGTSVNMTVVDVQDGGGPATGVIAWTDHGSGGKFSSLTCTLSPLGKSGSSACSVIYTIAPSAGGDGSQTSSCGSLSDLKVFAVYLGDPVRRVDQGSTVLQVCVP